MSYSVHAEIFCERRDVLGNELDGNELMSKTESFLRLTLCRMQRRTHDLPSDTNVLTTLHLFGMWKI